MSTSPIQEAISAKGKTHAQVAEAIGVSRQAVQKWANGTAPTLDNLKKLSRYLGVSVSALSGESQEKDDDFQLIDSFTTLHGDGWTVVPLIDAYGGCSCVGAFAQTGEVIGAVEFSDSFLLASPGVTGSITKDRFRLVAAYGDSMEPTIGKYDHCLIDLHQNQIRGDGIYWIQIDGSYFLKRIAKNYDGSITLISDNVRYPSQVVPKAVVDTSNVIGRVIRIVGLKDA